MTTNVQPSEDIIVNIKKCDCNPDLCHHAVTPDSDYLSCKECDIDYLKSHLKQTHFYDDGSVACGMCSSAMELKNTREISGYKEKFNFLVQKGYLTSDGFQK